MLIREIIKEEGTAGAIVSANIAPVVSPHAAKGKRPKDSKGLPKAPQKKNKDGTAVNALDMTDNVMGGKTIKR